MCYMYLKLRVIWKREKVSPKAPKEVIFFIHNIDID